MRSIERNWNFLGVTLLAALLLCPWPAAAAAQEVATMSVQGSSVFWAPKVAYDRLVLTVSGKAVYVRREFGAGATPSFAPFDAAGGSLPDGTYNWELRVIPLLPTPDFADPANGRDAGTRPMTAQVQLPKPQVQSGAFTLVGGELADPSRIEPRAPRSSGGTQIAGDLIASGAKHFAVIDPEDPERAIYYASLEGPEAATYLRGGAKTVQGEAVIALPEHFSKVTEPEGITVQLTPVGGWSRLYVVAMTPERLVVRDAEGRDGVEFNFLVQGVRKGYADYQVQRPALPVGHSESEKRGEDR